MKTNKIAMVILAIALALYILIPGLSWSEDGTALQTAGHKYVSSAACDTQPSTALCICSVFGNQSVTKLRVHGAGRGIAMLGVAHIPMPAILRSQSSRSSRISLTHAVRFAALAVMFAIPLAGQTGTPLTVA